MTSKECLEKIRQRYSNGSSFLEWCNIIKKDLNRLEELEKENEKLKCKNHDLLDEKLELVLNNHNQSMGIMELMKTIFVFKKIIKILKEKDVNIYILLHSKDLNDFNEEYNERYQLTQDQYDLLKEVLENVKED